MESFSDVTYRLRSQLVMSLINSLMDVVFSIHNLDVMKDSNIKCFQCTLLYNYLLFSYKLIHYVHVVMKSVLFFSFLYFMGPFAFGRGILLLHCPW